MICYYLAQILIGCLHKKCKCFPLTTPTMEHIEMQTRYHLIEVNLFYILVYDFLFFSLKIFKLIKVKKLSQIKLYAKTKGKQLFPY